MPPENSLVLNPASAHYDDLKEALEDQYEDIYFDEDAIFLERNSRDFKRRVTIMNTSAETLCDLLQARSSQSSYPTPAIKQVFYPKFITTENYTSRLVQPKSPTVNDGESSSTFAPGYGGLFSLTFVSSEASVAFFDHLACNKGPSLGSNFTLACPYTILAHFTELEWANHWGVEDNLVRVSVGLEDPDVLRSWFESALDMAERTI